MLKVRIATICARKGSKGLPGKNLAKIDGKSLVALATLQAVESSLFDFIVVSSDSEEILNEALSHGATHQVRRSSDLSGDFVSKPEVIRSAVTSSLSDLSKITTVVDLDVTSPLRHNADIVGAVSLLETSDCCSVLSGCPSRRNPYFNIVSLNKLGFIEISIQPIEPIYSRQLAPICFDLNAAVHAWKIECLISNPKTIYDKTLIYEMPVSRSMDIDSQTDYDIVNYLYFYNREKNV